MKSIVFHLSVQHFSATKASDASNYAATNEERWKDCDGKFEDIFVYIEDTDQKISAAAEVIVQLHDAGNAPVFRPLLDEVLGADRAYLAEKVQGFGLSSCIKPDGHVITINVDKFFWMFDALSNYNRT